MYFLRKPNVAALTGLGYETLDAWIEAGRFPVPVVEHRGETYWGRRAVLDWMQSQPRPAALASADDEERST
jgi:predicted DNA-binding transcriptional regulator AlpA